MIPVYSVYSVVSTWVQQQQLFGLALIPDLLVIVTLVNSSDTVGWTPTVSINCW